MSYNQQRLTKAESKAGASSVDALFKNNSISPDECPKIVSRITEALSGVICLFEGLQDHFKTNNAALESIDAQIEKFDRILLNIFRPIIVHLRIRLDRTKSHDLLLDTIYHTLSFSRLLPDLLKKYAKELPDDLADPGNFIANFAETQCYLVESLEDFVDSYPEALKPVAMDYPYWPMLQFTNTSANNHFPLIAQKLKLGSKCPIQVSKEANYSLKTPINRFVWKQLCHFQYVHRVIEWNDSGSESTAAYLKRAGRIYFDRELESEEIAIYIASSRLASLTKANAAEWADVALMPYVKHTFCDLRKVNELRNINTGPNGRRFAPVRKAVIQSLRSLARKP